MIQRQVLGQPGESKKLLAKYKGPYVITEVLPHDRYRIQDLPAIQRTQKLYEGVVAIDQRKPYLNIPDVSSDQYTEESDEEQVNAVAVEEIQVKKSTALDNVRSGRRKRRPKYLEDYE